MSKLKIFLIAIFSFIFIIAIGVGVYLLYLYNSVRFDVEKLIYYNPPLTTQIFDRNGKLLANIFDKENRLYVKYDNIPPKMIEALIAIEDTAFFEHHGVNVEAIFRAILKDIKARRMVEGASTLTQQLVKNVFLTRKKTISRKLKELMISIKIEKYLTKEQILERYFNQVYFGRGYYGIRTAAQGYFNKKLNELTLKEIAMLVGLPKAPSFYDPTRHYEFALTRANAVLRRMKTLGWISNEEYIKAITERPKVYRNSLTRNIAPFPVQTAIEQLRKRFPDIKTGGYDIYLTIDYDIQKIAKKALNKGYIRAQNIIKKYHLLDKNATSPLNGALISINPHTGDVLALQGSLDFYKSSFNRVTKSKRSVGSSIKPFIYQVALNVGYNPATKIPDISRTFKIETDNDEDIYWKPQNYEKNTLGLITLREALVHSRNLATINLVNEIGLDTVLKGLLNFGFRNIPNNLSIALGSFGVSMWNFSSYYTIFSNYGTRVYPRLIKKVINVHKGIDIEFPIRKDKVQDPAQAYLIIDILKDVVKKGTGRNAKVKGLEIAGKTGTTNDFKDAWFCGFSPDLETLVWFGRDDDTSIAKKMSGGRVSAPVFHDFYKEVLKLHPEMQRKFKIPEGIKYFIDSNGKKEIFTSISKPPKQKETMVPIF